MKINEWMSELFVLAKVTVVKIAKKDISVCGDVAAYISGSVMNNSVSSTVIHETCRICFNVNFNVNFNIVFKTIHLCISWWIKKNFDAI